MLLKKFIKNLIKNTLITIGITIIAISALFAFSSNPSCANSKKSAILDKYKPMCTLSGNYMPLQRWEAAEYSWCVTNDGIIIPGTYKKISRNTQQNYNYYKDIRFNECISVRKNMNINQNLVVLLGKIYNPYVS